MSGEVRVLINGLSSSDETRREASIARLAVMGSRATDRLVAAYASPDLSETTRLAILRVFEAVADPRSLSVARQALDEAGEIALAAVGILRRLLESETGSVSAEALDALVARVLDRSADRLLRVTALDALRDMPSDVHQRVGAALGDDPEFLVRSDRADVPREIAETDAGWQDALDGRLPGDPARLREAAATRASSAPLSALQKLIDAAKAREVESEGSPRATEWQAVRGALHQALALRGSTVALYDLRETLAAAEGPLPATFLAALHVVGDESCLDAIAAAYERAADDDRWRHQLAAAFEAIVKREALSRKHPAFKRIAARWPAAAAALSTTSRTTPRPTRRRRT